MTMIYFDRDRSLFPETVYMNEPLREQFVPVIRYEIDEPVTAFVGVRINGSDHLLWQSNLESPDEEYPYEGEIELGIESDVTVYEFLDEFFTAIPSTTTRVNYQWLAGVLTAPMEGHVTDVYEASTRIVTGSISFGTIAAVLGVAAIFVGAIMVKQ